MTTPRVTPNQFRDTLRQLRSEVSRVILGQPEVVDRLLVAFFAGGHVLLEGVPGLGKTLLAKTFATTLGLSFKRVQCTPDLMPADILGTQLVVERDGVKRFEFARGPVFTNILLADEINRTTPKTQSALLEAMEERQVTVAGTAIPLDEPFFVIATQNPIEMEGTYPLPEAQMDRFLFKIFVGYPADADLSRIIRQTTAPEAIAATTVLPAEEAAAWIRDARHLVREVLVPSPVEQYIVQLIRATHPERDHSQLPATKPGAPRDARGGAGVPARDGVPAERWLRYGASPRGAQALLLGAKVCALLDGRVNVSHEDVDQVLQPALNHRVILSFEAEAERRTPADILSELTGPVRAAR